jgi:hypothetical protein
MKKLLLSSIVLSLFAISMTLFQLSCKKVALAAITTTTAPTTIFQEGKMLVITSDNNIGIENYDGTGLVNLHVAIPQGFHIPPDANLSISPDHKTIFFALTDIVTTNGDAGYACNIDGSNVHKVDVSDWHIAY